eukprot:2054641-Alexandrium_andersonii.AAC.1
MAGGTGVEAPSGPAESLPAMCRSGITGNLRGRRKLSSTSSWKSTPRRRSSTTQAGSRRPSQRSSWCLQSVCAQMRATWPSLPASWLTLALPSPLPRPRPPPMAEM